MELKKKKEIFNKFIEDMRKSIFKLMVKTKDGNTYVWNSFWPTDVIKDDETKPNWNEVLSYGLDYNLENFLPKLLFENEKDFGYKFLEWLGQRWISDFRNFIESSRFVQFNEDVYNTEEIKKFYILRK